MCSTMTSDLLHRSDQVFWLWTRCSDPVWFQKRPLHRQRIPRGEQVARHAWWVHQKICALYRVWQPWNWSGKYFTASLSLGPGRHKNPICTDRVNIDPNSLRTVCTSVSVPSSHYHYMCILFEIVLLHNKNRHNKSKCKKKKTLGDRMKVSGWPFQQCDISSIYWVENSDHIFSPHW